MQNICEENEFVLANYYVPIAKTDKMSCKNQPYLVTTGIDGLDEFQQKSQDTMQRKGKGLIGRVYET